jgi:diguanylate cyclase (GGDEF)-like protein
MRSSSSLTETPIPARALGWLYLAGATIGLVSLLLPLPAHADVVGLYSNVGLAYLGAATLLIGARWTRPWMLQVALVAGSVLISRAVVLSGESVSFYTVWYIWVGLYAFYFFSRPMASAHVGLVGALYALTLVHDPPSSPVARWLTTMATLVVAAVFIDTLVRRGRRQADAVAASASGMARVAAVAHALATVSESIGGRAALCDGALTVTGAARTALWEPAVETGRLTISAQSGAAVASPAVPAGARRAHETGQPVRTRSTIAGTPTFSTWQPVVHEGRVAAVLELAWTEPGVEHDPSLTALVALLAVEVAVTLQRLGLLAELEVKARTDELTGLPNRRWWQERLPEELKTAASRGEELSVAIIDLDHFKLYNDTYGHQRGDALLRSVAAAWAAELRPTDLLARHGGEEFVVALPGCRPEQALAIVERLRGVLPESQRCSAGIAGWDGCESMTELLARADEALYQAKHDGRDQTALAGPPAPALFPASPAADLYASRP